MFLVALISCAFLFYLTSCCEDLTLPHAATSILRTTDRTSIMTRPPRWEGDKPGDQDRYARRAELNK
ncbi:unnamed protein product [Chondrus crispus]|uniref:Secreted protein n=1 Tax=Chondrus crispus TaxID=2769 RepID=R7QMI0_CHOCR|nr:unnamed protein product [Chondrus crispus]CDF38686.1 unnamed protein product [Chondrus crispus]|eukprot:XP_005718591.1 unnamed protein product [Chondrus crispus]